MVARLTRRALLARGAVAGAGLVVAGCGGATATTRSAPSEDLGRLEAALQDELNSAIAYAGLARTLDGAPGRLAARIEAAERRHADALRRLIARLGGGERPGREAPRPRLGGLVDALALEERSTAGHLELLARLRDPAAREVVGYVLAEEAAHAAVLRDALGREPVAGAFA